jgi:hypothetical protein
MADQKVNKNPRLGVNGLAKYVSATARQRRKILHDEKYPPDFKTVYYREAVAEIQRFLVDPDRKVSDLQDAAKRVAPVPDEEKNEKTRRNANALAIRSFAKQSASIKFDKLTPKKGPQQGSLTIEGVKLSVRPEVLLTGTHRKEECAGAMKLYLSKGTPLTDDGAGIAAALLKQHCESINGDCKHHNRHIIVVDVFAGVHFVAPQSVISKGHELKATCEEIAQRWASI